MKEALYYKKLEKYVVQCNLCPRICTIQESATGNCGVRRNIKGILYSLVYGKPCTVNIDPIEKKPLFHFIPGSTTYSIATAGCNFHCLNCQNWTISQAKFEQVAYRIMPPEKVVEDALKNDCESISYTYTEPTIFYEYMLDIAKLAKKQHIKNVLVSNGYINQEPLKLLCKYIDAANIDLKSIKEDFYKDICSGKLKPVLDTLKTLKEKKIWIEVTNLIIPELNDKLEEIKKLCEWVKNNLDKNTPLHFSKFFPMQRIINKPATPEETLKKAKEIAEKIGLKFVYIGNTNIEDSENTYCPKCKSLLIERANLSTFENNLQDGKCNKCKKKLPGIWY